MVKVTSTCTMIPQQNLINLTYLIASKANGIIDLSPCRDWGFHLDRDRELAIGQTLMLGYTSEHGGHGDNGTNKQA